MITLTGTVIDHITKVPIAEASVMLRYKDGASTDIAQITNDDGEFKWNNLESGDYELQVFCDGYESQLIPVTCHDDEVLAIRIALHKN